MRRWIRELKALGVCEEAVEWAKEKYYVSLQTAWRYCKHGDWMLWLAGKVSGPPESDSRKRLVLAACECARLSLRHVPKGEKRPLAAIETAEAWARGERGVTLQDVRAAADAAYDADAAYVPYVAYAAAYATHAAAAYAAHAAYAAIYAADAADARIETLAECAEIVRRHYPKVPV